MNLYGWHLSTLQQALGSNDAALLASAEEQLNATEPDELTLSQARAWLRTLIVGGVPLRDDTSAGPPADGGLLTVRCETSAHTIALYCLARALAGPDDLDLTGESSHWGHAAIDTVHRELTSCGFTKTKACGVKYFSWISTLSNGSPLFGDDFRTEWSFYSWFDIAALKAMIPVLRSAVVYERALPEYIPDDVRQSMPTKLSDTARDFVEHLTTWFERICETGQDALIFWW